MIQAKPWTTFAVGQRVVLSRVVAEKARGHAGVIEKLVKTRKVARVRIASGEWAGQTYDANVTNIDGAS